MEDFSDSNSENFGNKGLKSVEQFEPEEMPIKIKIGETEDEITVDRRLTKAFPITDNSQFISFVYILRQAKIHTIKENLFLVVLHGKLVMKNLINLQEN
jgi:hypothetical protein